MVSGEEVTKNILTAVQLKEQGNLAFKEGDYPAAIAAYHQIYMYVNGYSSSGGGGPPGLTGQTTKQVTQEEMVQIRELKLAHYCNLAMCHMKHGPKYLKARDNCTKALAIDPDNVKALFRRGKCYAQLNELDEAKADFERVLQLQPENSDAKRELRSLRGAFEKLRKREQKKFAGMFDRINLRPPAQCQHRRRQHRRSPLPPPRLPPPSTLLWQSWQTQWHLASSM
jgi:tetratricopeptide (TPR) repeat protein